MFMPRWASRITLEIVSVRSERLQEISEEDALAEGITCGCGNHQDCYNSNVDVFRKLWESINGDKTGRTWADNPFVWRIEFKVVKP
jgi:hypothetical protein